MRKGFFWSLLIWLMMQNVVAQTPPKTLQTDKITATTASAGTGSITGRYELYSGIPTVYIGHIVLQADGKYKVAFSNAEADYETGTFLYHAGTNSIEWLTGLFKNKNWQGKMIKKPGGYRIEFNKTTFAEN